MRVSKKGRASSGDQSAVEFLDFRGAGKRGVAQGAAGGFRRRVSERLAGGMPIHGERGAPQPTAGPRGFPLASCVSSDRKFVRRSLVEHVRFLTPNIQSKPVSARIFIKLPVADLPRSQAFCETLGDSRNTRFTDDTAACIVISEHIQTMLLAHAKFREFSTKDLCDTSKVLQVLHSPTVKSVPKGMNSGAKPSRRAARRSTRAGPQLRLSPRCCRSRRPLPGTQSHEHHAFHFIALSNQSTPP
jgi:predicted lactoylglutathione lyase